MLGIEQRRKGPYALLYSSKLFQMLVMIVSYLTMQHIGVCIVMVGSLLCTSIGSLPGFLVEKRRRSIDSIAWFRIVMYGLLQTCKWLSYMQSLSSFGPLGMILIGEYLDLLLTPILIDSTDMQYPRNAQGQVKGLLVLIVGVGLVLLGCIRLELGQAVVSMASLVLCIGTSFLAKQYSRKLVPALIPKAKLECVTALIGFGVCIPLAIMQYAIEGEGIDVNWMYYVVSVVLVGSWLVIEPVVNNQIWREMEIAEYVIHSLPVGIILSIVAGLFIPNLVFPEQVVALFFVMGGLLLYFNQLDSYDQPSQVPWLFHYYLKLIAGLSFFIAAATKDRSSKRILTFLLINLSFMGVEMVYGYWTNSLGLISDAFHMLFDCTALVIALVATVMASWPANSKFSYGYQRIETLAGLTNGVFLVIVALFVVGESIGRFVNPPVVDTDRLLLVSVGGLIVNLIGMFAFADAHEHAHGHDHQCPLHNHKHDHHHHDHDHHHHDHDHHHHDHHHHDHHHHHGGGENLMALYLHILADTMGSVAVIISTLLIMYFDLHISDPICSLILSLLILGSVIPLLKSSVKVVLQGVPSQSESGYQAFLSQVSSMPGVLSIRKSYMWKLANAKQYVAIHLHCQDDLSISHTKQEIQKYAQRNHLVAAIQIEKSAFFSRVGFFTGSSEGH